jgi:ribosome-associated protein
MFTFAAAKLMLMGKTKTESDMLASLVVKGLQEKFGRDIVSLSMKSIPMAVSDYFIICHGTSATHVETLIESVEHFVKKATGLNPHHREGLENSEWVLLDYFDVLVHVFQEPARHFYQLEKLWADAERKEYVI